MSRCVPAGKPAARDAPGVVYRAQAAFVRMEARLRMRPAVGDAAREWGEVAAHRQRGPEKRRCRSRSLFQAGRCARPHHETRHCRRPRDPPRRDPRGAGAKRERAPRPRHDPPARQLPISHLLGGRRSETADGQITPFRRACDSLRSTCHTNADKARPHHAPGWRE
ncbi:hypothetical protein GQF56_08510 [Rhodobacter sphaeroides]|jgi:hypothetical protein|uniref:Uncharacterized protein n=1 Tax=Cereibacter sphaeroides (strain ATCC 17023 / DSM 158 / JCM 6121 / CCUG 31486 / LMG 2827 / NBRC 12203 / NCIMB 8253 / ATH 2.4.1.) TaxID=272943 RepID=Q3J2R6_CERS4|nr:hypothetical protein RSP_2762 [Cereibacter sphaeroides 2.4.1]AXC61125.1 hypothetical protein DQL45_07025 [Cereibacter sphaeroides 2.4.1]MVX47911.1 hypothetical protein [Cereibacter sphaeroides]